MVHPSPPRKKEKKKSKLKVETRIFTTLFNAHNRFVENNKHYYGEME